MNTDTDNIKYAGRLIEHVRRLEEFLELGKEGHHLSSDLLKIDDSGLTARVQCSADKIVSQELEETKKILEGL